MINDSLNPFKTYKLNGLDSYFDNFVNQIKNKNLPKVSLLSGNKGIGKFTMVIHLLNFYFTRNEYNISDKSIDRNSTFNKSLFNNINSNVIIISNENLNTKIEEIRNLKKILLQTPLNNSPRFIILDNIDLFNINSLNALLKVIEEPSASSYFFLINNQEQKILETVSSRCLETKIFLKHNERINIIEQLIDEYSINKILEYNATAITPGQYLVFNQLCDDHDINIESDYLSQINKLLKLYKKTKDISFIKLTIFITEQYFYNLSKKDSNDPIALNDIKLTTIKSINNFVTYNLNLSSIINSISLQFSYVR